MSSCGSKYQDCQSVFIPSVDFSPLSEKSGLSLKIALPDSLDESRILVFGQTTVNMCQKDKCQDEKKRLRSIPRTHEVLLPTYNCWLRPSVMSVVYTRIRR